MCKYNMGGVYNICLRKRWPRISQNYRKTKNKKNNKYNLKTILTYNYSGNTRTDKQEKDNIQINETQK
jgi:hypothetical protein